MERKKTGMSREGYSVISNVEVDGIGLCTIKRIMRVTGKEDLTKYLSLSGFGSLDDWWAKIHSFGACDGWLFEVSVISASSLASRRNLHEKQIKNRSI